MDFNSPFSRTVILAHFEEDRGLLAEVLESFMDSYPAMLAAIRQAILTQSAGALFLAAHSLKGAVATFYLNDAVDLVKQLESLAVSGLLADAPMLSDALDLEMSRVVPPLQIFLQELAPCAS